MCNGKDYHLAEGTSEDVCGIQKWTSSAMAARGPVAIDFQQKSFEDLGNLGDKKD